jgi:hypothetical protein
MRRRSESACDSCWWLHWKEISLTCVVTRCSLFSPSTSCFSELLSDSQHLPSLPRHHHLALPSHNSATSIKLYRYHFDATSQSDKAANSITWFISWRVLFLDLGAPATTGSSTSCRTTQEEEAGRLQARSWLTGSASELVEVGVTQVARAWLDFEKLLFA